jgi:hypothetical protein
MRISSSLAPFSDMSRPEGGLSIAGSETYTMHPNFMISDRDFIKRLSAVHSLEGILLPKTFPLFICITDFFCEK